MQAAIQNGKFGKTDNFDEGKFGFFGICHFAMITRPMSDIWNKYSDPCSQI